MRTNNPDKNTIAAIATPVGPGGIGVVRLSGPRALAIARSLFRPVKPLEGDLAPRRLYYGQIINPETRMTLDEVLVASMPGPHSFTREDVAEIQAHGSPVALTAILDLVLAQGARLAEPGEFTRRAFENGRIDLTQAEAVMDIVQARTLAARDMAARQMQGVLGQAIEEISSCLVGKLAELEAALDFADEAGDTSMEDLAYALESRALAPLRDILSQAGQGQVLREGIRAAFVGRPNVGKSSLLNAFLARNRAIVTPIPGTTRDVIEETAFIDGQTLVLADTAGFHLSPDPIERAGMEKGRSAMEQAQVVVLVVEAHLPPDPRDLDILESLSGKSVVVASNKTDLVSPGQPLQAPPQMEELPWIPISAKFRHGLPELARMVVSCARIDDPVPEASFLAPNRRQEEALGQAARSIETALAMARKDASPELLAVDLHEALQALGEVTGITLDDKVLDTVFSRFCIGK